MITSNHEHHRLFPILIATGALLSACSPPDGLKTVMDVPLGGGSVRFDYQSLDSDAHRLFISHMNADQLVVFDTQSNQVIKEIPGLPRVTGVLVVPTLGKVYASASGANEVHVIDEKTLADLATVPGGTFPDGLAYDPNTRHLFVSDESGGTDTVIDTDTNQVLATIPLGGEAGNTQFDPVAKLMYVNEQSTNELIAIDPTTNTIRARHALSGAQGNHGLYIDAPKRLAFIACEGNAKLLVYDLNTQQVVASDSLGVGPDVLAFDPELGRLYVASESGIVSIFKEEGRTLRKLSEGFVGWNAHSVAVDPATHRIYLPIPTPGGQPVLRMMEFQ